MTNEHDTKKQVNPLFTVLLVLIGILLLIILFLLIQTNRPGPLPGHQPFPPEPKHLKHELKSISGTVKGFVQNVHRDINGLKIETASRGALTFEFRPHTASAVLSAGHLEDSVQLEYFTQPNDESITYRLKKIKNLRSGEVTDIDNLPPPPRIPTNQTVQTFDLNAPEIVTDPYGGIAALRYEHKLFHFKPEQVEDIQSLIKLGRVFVLQAVRRGDDQGFVNADQNEVYIVISITIDNKTFMIR